MTGFRLAEVGRLGQPVDPLRGGDVDPLTGSLLSVAEIRDLLADRQSTPLISVRRTVVTVSDSRRGDILTGEMVHVCMPAALLTTAQRTCL